MKIVLGKIVPGEIPIPAEISFKAQSPSEYIHNFVRMASSWCNVEHYHKHKILIWSGEHGSFF